MTLPQLIDGCDLFAETFTDISLPNAKLSKAEFEDCVFVSCDFSATYFANCKFINCRFEDCNMTVVKLAGTKISGCTFISCKLGGVDWTMCAWQGVLSPQPLRFHGSILDDGNFYGLVLDDLELVACRAKEVDFTGGSFVRGRFRGSDFMGAIFEQTTLFEADFTEAQNTRIDPRSNRLKGARFNRDEALYMIEAMGIIVVD